MTTYRVLYVDSAGEGRFADLTAPNPGAAAWTVAMDTAQRSGIHGQFVGMAELAGQPATNPEAPASPSPAADTQPADVQPATTPAPWPYGPPATDEPPQGAPAGPG